MLLFAAVAVWCAATAGLVVLSDAALTWYYHLAWWSYIAGADAVHRRLGGRSLLRDEPRRLAWLALGSVAWWTAFEAINLRLGNWYYVMDPPSRAVRWTAGVLAFATVLPGIAVTVRLVESLGWLRSVPVAPLRWSVARERAVVALGAACFALPLASPDLFFPLTWGSFVFLLEPWNSRHARESYLRDLERGEAGPLLRVLAAGLVCGLLWEAWNHGARMKWIYTVPGFESLKIFEMPLAGFFGFPPFAVESVVAIRSGEALWARVPPRRKRLAATAAVVLVAAVVAAVFPAADAVTVDSFYVPVDRLSVLAAAPRERLAAAGLHSPEKLLRALRTAKGRAAQSARTGLSTPELEAIRARVALVMHRGIGDERARQLEALGVRTVADLTRWRSADLSAALRARGAWRRDRFLDRRVRAWVEDGRLLAGGEPGQRDDEPGLHQVEHGERAVQRAEAARHVAGERARREVEGAAQVTDHAAEPERLRHHDGQRGHGQPARRAAQAPGHERARRGQPELRDRPPPEHPAVDLGGDVP
ncbi:MAG TPA: DUF4332 domain-containing protein [Vicinamibacteria bacterium]